MSRMKFRFPLFCPLGFLFLVTFALVLLPNQNVYSADVTLVWDNNVEEELDGYRIYYKTCSSCDWTSGTGATEGDSPIDIPLQILGDPEHPEYTIHELNDDTAYFFVATAYDIYVNESDYSNQVSYYPPENLRLEIGGEVSVDQNWKWVEFSESFQDPIVVAKSLSSNGGDPAVVRIRNVDATGFEIRVQEWEYLDGSHAEETVGYIVMERGTYTLADGTTVEAERFETDNTSSFGQTTFSRTFQEVPVVITAVSSYNEADAVTTRVRNISTNGFELRMQEQEANSQIHNTETISYIAWEPSSGIINGLAFEVNKTGDVITDGLHTIVYDETFMDIPVFLADMQTTDGWDTANLRWQDKDFYAVDVKVAEEQSGDSETSHTTEVVGYMLFSGTGSEPEEVIIDNGDAGTSSTRTWRVSGAANPYGDSSLYSTQAGATYTFEAAVDGPYEVSMWWTERPSRCTGVPVEIYDGYTLLDTIEINQLANAGQWNVLGTYIFSGTARVVIISESSNCSTCADAVKFVPDTQNAGNLPPLANDDSAATGEDTPVTINVIANDTDSDGTIDPATVVVMSNPASGAVVVNGDGTVTYTPNPGFTGTDAFTYTVDDNDSATSNETTVTVSVLVVEVVIDNGDAGTSSTGTWRVSSGENPYGDSSLYGKKPGDTYTFETAIDGSYEVSLWWSVTANRCTSVPVEIYDGYTLLDTIEINQLANAGQWNVLGTYIFSGTARVVIISESSSCSTCADAVRFVSSAW